MRINSSPSGQYTGHMWSGFTLRVAQLGVPFTTGSGQQGCVYSLTEVICDKVAGEIWACETLLDKIIDQIPNVVEAPWLKPDFKQNYTGLFSNGN